MVEIKSPLQSDAEHPWWMVLMLLNPLQLAWPEKAKACASSISPSSPTSSILQTAQSLPSAIICISVGLCRPPSVTKIFSGGLGQNSKPLITLAALIAVMVATASCAAAGATNPAILENASLSSDFGAICGNRDRTEIALKRSPSHVRFSQLALHHPCLYQNIRAYNHLSLRSQVRYQRPKARPLALERLFADQSKLNSPPLRGSAPQGAPN